MTRRRFLAVLVTLTVLAVSGKAFAAEPAAIEETRASVPALSEFHEVVFPLWHEAWPNKNYSLIADLLPRAREHVQRIRSAELPGILRDRKTEWAEGVSALAEALKLYEKAVEAHDEKGMLDAVEVLHAEFEGLVRVIRPAMKELDAYHVELYGVYHKIFPEKNFDRMLPAVDAMADKCRALAAAEVPKRFTAKEGEIRIEIGILCRDTDALREVARGSDPEAVGASVEKVHTQYRKLEAIFR